MKSYQHLGSGCARTLIIQYLLSTICILKMRAQPVRNSNHKHSDLTRKKSGKECGNLGLDPRKIVGGPALRNIDKSPFLQSKSPELGCFERGI